MSNTQSNSLPLVDRRLKSAGQHAWICRALGPMVTMLAVMVVNCAQTDIGCWQLEKHKNVYRGSRVRSTWTTRQKMGQPVNQSCSERSIHSKGYCKVPMCQRLMRYCGIKIKSVMQDSIFRGVNNYLLMLMLRGKNILVIMALRQANNQATGF